MLDYLHVDQSVVQQGPNKNQSWMGTSSQLQRHKVAQTYIQQRNKTDEAWKQDPCIQAIAAERMQQIEQELRAETTQGKRKRSGRYNVTDSSSTASFRQWLNECILVGSMKKRMTFDELSQVQFIMGFVKNVNDTIDL